VSHDPALVLRDHAVAPLRRALFAPGTRLLRVDDGSAVARDGEEAGYDAAWVELESVVDAAALASSIGRAVRPGGRLVSIVPGAWPLPATLVRALRGPEAPAGESRGVRGTVPLATAAQWRRALAPFFVRRRSYGVGVLVPAGVSWPGLDPLVLAALAAAEHVVAGWPVARTLGEWTVFVGERR
jgi:SAM-dependent methyltransferase